MSGIAGAWNTDGRPVEEAVIRRAGATIAHRGRDRADAWCSGAIGFITCLDRITPESAFERQPLSDQSGNALVFDGRLDNRDDLLRELTDNGVTPNSPDAAIVFAAFGRWGQECLPRLNGEFAVVVFDARNQELVLARDPVGCRPLYYWSNGCQVVFGSEIKAVVAHAEVPLRPNEDLLADYIVRDRLSYEDLGETFFQDVRAVLPGQRVVVSRRGVRSQTFWDFDTASIVRLESYADYAERLRELLFEAVKRRLRSAHPVALAVSGGLDSSIVLCVADQIRRHHTEIPLLLPVCLISSSGHTEDERHALTPLETTTEIPIERVTLGDPADESTLKNAAWHSEWPRFDDGWMAHRAMVRWAREHGSRCLLSGHWSDQLSFTTGYLSDLFIRLRWREIARHLHEYTQWFVDADPQYFRRRFLRELAFNLTSPRLRRWARPFVSTNRPLNQHEFIADGVIARVKRPRPALPRPRCRSAHARDIYQTVRSLAHRLQFEADEKLGAGCQIERTTPFLDRDLIAFMMSVPGEIQNRGGIPRALLRDSMRGIVPDAILQRRWRNEDEIVRARATAYVSMGQSLDASHALGFLKQPLRVDRETLDLLGLEFWSRAFFSDTLTPLPHQSHGVCEAMDTVDPAPKDDDGKLPYSPPKLTVHGDLRKITAAKQSDRSESGQPKTFNSGMP